MAVHAARLGARATKRRAACQSGSPNLSATRAAAARRRSRRSIMAGRVDVRHHFSGHNDTWQRQRFKNTTFDEYFVAACFEYAVRPPASNGVVAASEKAHAFERRISDSSPALRKPQHPFLSASVTLSAMYTVTAQWQCVTRRPNLVTPLDD